MALIQDCKYQSRLEASRGLAGAYLRQGLIAVPNTAKISKGESASAAPGVAGDACNMRG